MIRFRVLFAAICLLCVAALIAIIPLNNRQAITPEVPTVDAVKSSTPRGNPTRHLNLGQRIINQQMSPTAQKTEPDTMELTNELIVRLKSGSTNIDEVATSLNAQVTGRSEKLNAYRLQFEDAAAATSAREKLAGNSDIESLDSNYAIVRPPGSDAAAGILASPATLTVTPGNSNGQLIIGLIDTAVQVQSSGLNESFFLPTVSIAGESGPDEGLLTHGTSMAEAILQGVSTIETGNAPTIVRILPVDVYGSAETTTTFQVAEGIVQAVGSGATIINLSMGTDGNSSLLQQVIQDAHAQGIIFFGAAGNEPVTTANYPAAYPDVVAVTAIDGQGNIASYANYGNFVDVAAPGTIIVSYNGQSYLVTGTSASAALTSGVAAGLVETTGSTPATVETTVRTALGAF